MSERALESRAWRQRVAAPGGRQDRVVRIARVALPMAAGVLVALLAMAPLTSGRDVSFLLDKNKVDVAPERMRAEAAEYRGQDDAGRPFSVSAQSAVQRVEYSLDASRWRVVYPKDGIPDSRREEFEIVLQQNEAARSVIIRATDAMNNVATAVSPLR